MRHSGRIYIIPTRFGLLFLFGVVVMLLVGATYSNNLVNLLAFFLLAITMVAMVQTHNNLRNIKLQMVDAEPGFAMSTFSLNISLENAGREPRFNIDIQPFNLEFARPPETSQPIPASASSRLRGVFQAPQRGRHQLKKVRVSTVYPLGLFYSWMWFACDKTYLIYPEAKGTLPLPLPNLDPADSTRILGTRGGDDFHGHRRYLPGDPARRVDWRAFARGRPLLTKEFDEGDPKALFFDWHQLPGLPVEARLSQLTAWSDHAFRQRLPYALNLPHVFIPAGDDLQHHLRCLEELATYGEAAYDKGA